MKGLPEQRPEEEITGFIQGAVGCLSGIKQNKLAFISGVQNFFCQGPRNSTLGRVGSMVSTATTRLCCCTTNTVIDHVGVGVFQ